MAKVRSTSRIHRPHGPRLFSSTSSLAAANQARTNTLINQLTSAIARSIHGSPNAKQRLAQQLVFSLLGAHPYPATIRQAFSDCVNTIVRDELTPLYMSPTATPDSDALSEHHIRNAVRAQLDYLANETAAITAWQNVLRAALNSVARAIPSQRPEPSSLTIKVPLVGILSNPTQTIDALVREVSSLASEPNAGIKQPGQGIANTIIANLLAVSRIDYDDAQKRPHRLVWPADANLPPTELVTAFLSRTPFASLFQTQVELVIPDNLLVEGGLITALPGHGKTQALQSMVLRHLNNPAAPSVIVIDSQGDALRVLSRLKCFDPANDTRLVIIDPTDPHPPACNLFGWDRTYAETLSERQREEFLAGIIEMFHFVAGGLLGTEFTGRMSVVFRYLAMWLIEIPNSNIHTLIQILQDPTPHLDYINRLPPTAQNFIEQIYQRGSKYGETRQHILQRLYHVISNPAFERMFGHTENKFDLRAAMNGGKCILINTAKAQLHPEWSAIFGRFWLAQLLQATMSRAFVPQAQRRLAIALIDEAHEYCNETTEMLLFQARKYRVSINLIHQTTDQLRKADVYEAVKGIPALRYTGAVTDTDAKLLAREMNTTPEFIKSVRKTPHSAEWAVYARNVTSTATKITMPFLEAEREPKMTDAAYQHLLERNRQQVGAPRLPSTAPTTTPPITNDGDTY